ncbi:MAG: hypothetical protein Kow0027_07310 [Saprospiraceae bacterium]|jgi:cell division protein FtsB|nr:hypothetical protein [Saprospirales bacterium]
MARKPANNPFESLLKQVPKPLRNKYVLTLLAFLAILLVLDKHDLYTQWKLHKSVKQLEKDKEYYHEKINEANRDKDVIENNQERFARESYQMHKSDEEVFVIPDEDEK